MMDPVASASVYPDHRQRSSAMALRMSEFVTGDRRQASLARAAGLEARLVSQR